MQGYIVSQKSQADETIKSLEADISSKTEQIETLESSEVRKSLKGKVDDMTRHVEKLSSQIITLESQLES